MSAKHKLNEMHLAGALAIAGCVGGLSQSWTVFAVALVGLLLTGLLTRDIRL